MSAKPAPSVDGATLLVVDDNELNRDMLGRRLEKKGYRVLFAADGTAALETVSRESVDLLLLDIEKPGHVLAGKYRLEALIGSGAFGSVYRARHLELEHDVAVKVLQTAAGRTPEALARFKREGIAACRVKHPSAVTVTDFGVTDGGAAFLVMELLEGHGLDEEIQRSGCMAPARCAEILSPLCGALAEAHA